MFDSDTGAGKKKQQMSTRSRELDSDTGSCGMECNEGAPEPVWYSDTCECRKCKPDTCEGPSLHNVEQYCRSENFRC